MKIIEKFDRQFEYAGILMNVFIAFQFFLLWKQPQLADVDKIASMSALIMFEFVLIHSGVLMSIMPRKTSLYSLVPFYGIFALAFSFVFDNYFILFTYLTVILNRTRFAFSDVSEEIRDRTLGKSILATLIYIVLMFVILPAYKYIPQFGLNEAYIQASGYGVTNNIDGIFAEFPHAAMAFGVAYYCSLAVVETRLLKRNFTGKQVAPISKT